jgi:dihydroorotate dehydrogenase
LYNTIRSLFFLLPAEKAHYVAMDALQKLCAVNWIRRKITKQFLPSDKNRKVVFGIDFPNPVGLAAGFDKNAAYLQALQCLGFGFIEIGTVTPIAQEGNPKPRLFRLPADKALINRMGFNNAGMETIAENLRNWRLKESKEDKTPMIIGGNIGKNKITPNEDAWQDYIKCFHALHAYVDYFVVNVSSPNTPGLRELQEKDALYKILTSLQKINKEKQIQRPILLKIAPDLSNEQIDDVLELATEITLNGLVISNTTLDRSKLSASSSSIATEVGAGGLSGLPSRQRSTDIVQYAYERLQGEIPIIASGGIFTGADAREKLNAGADLLQVWTGFIYEGPAIAKKISDAL